MATSTSASGVRGGCRDQRDRLLASCLAAGNCPAGKQLCPCRPPPGLGVVVGDGERLGFLGQLLRLAEASLRVDRFGEPGQDAARYPLAHLRQRLASFGQIRSAAAGFPAIISIWRASIAHMPS